MTSRFTELTVDCRDPERLAAFWCAVPDFEVIDRSEDKAGTGSRAPAVEEVRTRRMPPTVVFVRVPGNKSVKNRLHLGVSPVDGSADDEVTRLLGLGATTVDVGQGPGRSRVVMAGPGGRACVGGVRGEPGPSPAVPTS